MSFLRVNAENRGTRLANMHMLNLCDSDLVCVLLCVIADKLGLIADKLGFIADKLGFADKAGYSA